MSSQKTSVPKVSVNGHDFGLIISAANEPKIRTVKVDIPVRCAQLLGTTRGKSGFSPFWRCCTFVYSIEDAFRDSKPFEISKSDLLPAELCSY
jgi:hypothetical protein